MKIQNAELSYIYLKKNRLNAILLFRQFYNCYENIRSTEVQGIVQSISYP